MQITVKFVNKTEYNTSYFLDSGKPWFLMMIDKTLFIVFGFKRALLYCDEECTDESDRRLTYEVLFV